MLTKGELNQISQTVVVPLRKDINKLDKKMIKLINYFDRDVIVVKKRVDKIERHLGLPVNPNL